MRLIDAEDLYSQFEDEYEVSHKIAMATLSDYRRGFCDGVNLGCLRILKAPAIEAEPVVRCRDCKYWKERLVNEKGFIVCAASGMDATADDFCSYGERREDNAVD